jgi:hypothetical protein
VDTSHLQVPQQMHSETRLFVKKRQILTQISPKMEPCKIRTFPEEITGPNLEILRQKITQNQKLT